MNKSGLTCILLLILGTSSKTQPKPKEKETKAKATQEHLTKDSSIVMKRQDQMIVTTPCFVRIEKFDKSLHSSPFKTLQSDSGKDSGKKENTKKKVAQVAATETVTVGRSLRSRGKENIEFQELEKKRTKRGKETDVKEEPKKKVARIVEQSSQESAQSDKQPAQRKQAAQSKPVIEYEIKDFRIHLKKLPATEILETPATLPSKVDSVKSSKPSKELKRCADLSSPAKPQRPKRGKDQQNVEEIDISEPTSSGTKAGQQLKKSANGKKGQGKTNVAPADKETDKQNVRGRKAKGKQLTEARPKAVTDDEQVVAKPARPVRGKSKLPEVRDLKEADKKPSVAKAARPVRVSVKPSKVPEVKQVQGKKQLVIKLTRTTRKNSENKASLSEEVTTQQKESSSSPASQSQPQVVAKKQVPQRKTVETKSTRSARENLKTVPLPDVVEKSTLNNLLQPKLNAESSKESSNSEIAKQKKTSALSATDEQADDPYSFEMSQTEEGTKNKKKPKKQRAAQAKPGNQIELLMKQKQLRAVEFSCNVQNNPALYEAQRGDLEKKINNVPAPTVVIVDDRASDVISKVKVASPKSLVAPKVNAIVKTSSKVDISVKPSFSKVFHSPKAQTSSQSPVGAVHQYMSDSPPIASSYALKMIELRKTASDPGVNSPLRVSGTHAKAFYFGLSSTDGTPSYSSDLVEKAPLEPVLGDTFTLRENKSGEHSGSKSDAARTSVKIVDDQASFLGDSNAENMEPPGASRSPVKQMRKATLRSPLKALSLPAAEVSSLSAFNVTVDQTIPVKKMTIIDDFDESRDLDEICEEAEKLASQNAELSQTIRDDSVSRDTFGFDELFEKVRGTANTSPKSVLDTEIDAKKKLDKIKHYLPSKHNKNRDQDVFPTSPMKPTAVFKEVVTNTATLKSFSASTPLAPNSKGPKLSFADMSAVEESSELTIENIDSSDGADETGPDLFADQTNIDKVSNMS